MAVLTTNQEIVLASISLTSSLVSIACSSVLLCFLVARRKHQHEDHPCSSYHRLLFGLSAMDIVNSTGFSMQSFLAPKSDDHALANGNEATCNLLGFLAQFGIASALYNGMLNANFMLTICYEYDQAFLSKRVEPWMHMIAILWPLLTAAVMVPIRVYDEIQVGMGCYVVDNPTACVDGTELACHATIIGWVFGGGPLLLVIFFLIVSNIMIYCKVRTISNKSAQYEIPGRDLKKTKQVASQAILYVVACLNTLVWQISVRGVESMELVTRETESDVFWLLVLTSVFYPLQGFWNLLIYVRPKYVRFRHRFPAYTRSVCLWKTLRGPAPPSTSTLEFTSRGRLRRMSFPTSAVAKQTANSNNNKLVAAGNGAMIADEEEHESMPSHLPSEEVKEEGSLSPEKVDTYQETAADEIEGGEAKVEIT